MSLDNLNTRNTSSAVKVIDNNQKERYSDRIDTGRLDTDVYDRSVPANEFSDPFLEAVSEEDRVPKPGIHIGHYQFLRMLGNSDFKQVYLGYDPKLDKQVVIKVVQTRLASDEIEGFYREAQTIASLKHPYIAKLLDFGVQNNIPYLVMEYSPRGTLRQRYSVGEPQSLTSILPTVKQLAAALQYAHTRNVVHGDIRPENMLLGENGQVLLSDFSIDALGRNRYHWGLKEESSTIAYLAPEQMQGKPLPASDEYALACVIYEWLCGTPPFQGSFIAVARKQLDVPPPPLRQRNEEVSPFVEDVVLTALAKHPNHRFTSIPAFVNALEQAQNTQGVSIPLSGQGRTFSSALPKPVSLYSSVQSVDTSVRDAKVNDKVSRRKVVVGLLGLLAVGGSALEIARVQGMFTSSPIAAPTATALRRGTTIFTYRGHSARVSAIAWSPDGKRLASASDDKVVQISDGRNGNTLLTYDGHSGELYTVAWSPDGQYIASAGADKTVQVWSAITGKKIYTYKGHTAAVNAVSWSPDSKHIASASDDHTVQVWNAIAKGRVLFYGGHLDGVLAVTWSPDGKRIASGSWDNTMRVWNAVTGKEELLYLGHSAEIYSIAWSPDGKHLASASADTTVQVCDSRVGLNKPTYHGHSDVVLAVSWSPNGQFITSGGYDNTVQLWNSTTGKHIFTYDRHSNWVNAIAWAPENQRIATGGYDTTVQVWQAQ